MKRFIITALCFAAMAHIQAETLWMSFETELGARWVGTAGQANGVWDVTRNHTPDIASGSMKIQRSPVPMEVRTRISEMDGVTSKTVVGIWFYDDGEDLKGFNLMMKTDGDKHRVGMGLRDDVVGSDTPYVFDVNGTVTSTGVMRSVGWHRADFGFTPGSGVEGRVDGYGWVGNVFVEAAFPDWFQFQTNYGTGDNNVWIDDIGLEIDGVLPPKNSVESWMDYSSN